MSMRFPSRTTSEPSQRSRPGTRAAWGLALAVVCAAILLGLPGADPVAAQTSTPSAADEARVAGQYRIDAWKQLERQKIALRFLLKPDGAFELGAEWPYHETSRFTGTWSLSGGRVVLQGEGEVWTNQGAWRTPFARGYTVSEKGGTIVLTPQPEKNRYGLMGWPNAFERFADTANAGAARSP